MDRFLKSRLFAALIYTILGLIVIALLLQVKPVIVGVAGFLKTVLAPFAIAMIISYVLNPIVSLLNERKMPRTIAVLLIYGVFIASIVVVAMNVIPMFMKQLKELNEHMPELTMKAQTWFDGIVENRSLPESVREGINRSLNKLESTVTVEISNFLNGLGDKLGMVLAAFIIPFLAFYILKDFQLIEKTVLAIVPKTHRRDTVKLVRDIDTALGNYIRGQFLVCLIIGLLAYIGYWLIDMPYPLLLAGIVALFNIVPYLGPFLGAAPALLMAVMISWKMVLLVAVVNLTVQILEGNVISPQVVGRRLHIHPLFIIFALLVGGQLAGIVGLILAVPVFAALKVIIQHILMHYVQKRTT